MGRREGDIYSHLSHTKAKVTQSASFSFLIAAFFFFVFLSSINMKEIGSNQIEYVCILSSGLPHSISLVNILL